MTEEQIIRQKAWRFSVKAGDLIPISESFVTRLNQDLEEFANKYGIEPLQIVENERVLGHEIYDFCISAWENCPAEKKQYFDIHMDVPMKLFQNEFYFTK